MAPEEAEDTSCRENSVKDTIRTVMSRGKTDYRESGRCIEMNLFFYFLRGLLRRQRNQQ
jgi:hypothetical protein